MGLHAVHCCKTIYLELPYTPPHTLPDYTVIRSQIYLTEEERRNLKLISKQTGRTQSDLIREAVDLLISRKMKKDSVDKRLQAFGLWKDNDNCPQIKELRNEFDRAF